MQRTKSTGSHESVALFVWIVPCTFFVSITYHASGPSIGRKHGEHPLSISSSDTQVNIVQRELERSSEVFSKLGRIVVLSLLMVTTLSVALPTQAQYVFFAPELAEIQYAVAVGEVVNIRSMPCTSQSCDILYRAERAEQFLVLGEAEESLNPQSVSIGGVTSNVWLRLALPDDQIGFGWVGLFSVTTLYRADGITFAVESGVPQEDVEAIVSGTLAMSSYLNDELDGDDTLALEPVISIFNRDSSELAEDGVGCCVGTTDGEPRPRFYIQNEQWSEWYEWEDWIPIEGWPEYEINLSLYQRHVFQAGHEYHHSWQLANGCLYDQDGQAQWFTEGSAEWAGHQSAISAGLITETDSWAFHEWNAFASAPNLRNLERPSSQAWLPSDYSWGAYAVNMLVNEHGVDTLRQMCEAESELGNFREAFESVYGISVDDFYAEFDTFVTNELGFTEPRPAEYNEVPTPEETFVSPQMTAEANANGCIPPIVAIDGMLSAACQSQAYQRGMWRLSFVIRVGSDLDSQEARNIRITASECEGFTLWRDAEYDQITVELRNTDRCQPGVKTFTITYTADDDTVYSIQLQAVYPNIEPTS